MNERMNKYPDGSTYAKVRPDDNKQITWRLDSYEDLWHLNQYVEAYNHAFGFEPDILIPNLIDAQADRRFNNLESSGLKLVCNFLNSMDAKFTIFHPHNAEVVEALIDGVTILDNTDFIMDVVYNNLFPGPGFIDTRVYDELILMSSDAGGFKPLMKLCDNINWEGEVYSASKSRDRKTHKLTQIIDRQDFGGKDILIIDDLSIYGGTFKGLSTLLQDRNVGKLYLAVSHMTMQNLGDDPVTNYFDQVFTSNSKFDNYFMKSERGEAYQPANLVIL